MGYNGAHTVYLLSYVQIDDQKCAQRLFSHYSLIVAFSSHRGMVGRQQCC